MPRAKSKKIRWDKYRVRRCKWFHECNVCGLRIEGGHRYYDGGYGRRAHLGCGGVAEHVGVKLYRDEHVCPADDCCTLEERWSKDERNARCDTAGIPRRRLFG